MMSFEEFCKEMNRRGMRLSADGKYFVGCRLKTPVEIRTARERKKAQSDAFGPSGETRTF